MIVNNLSRIYENLSVKIASRKLFILLFYTSIITYHYAILSLKKSISRYFINKTILFSTKTRFFLLKHLHDIDIHIYLLKLLFTNTLKNTKL